MTLDKRDFYFVLYKLIILLGVFDGIRTKLVFGGPFTVFKELSVLVILLGIFYKDGLRITKRQFWVSAGPLITYLMLIGTVAVTFNDVSPKAVEAINREMATGYALHIKTIESFLLIYIFSKFSILTNRSFKPLILFFIRCCVAYSIINYVFYFWVPTSVIHKPWYGRISVGYPTADAQILCMGIFCLLFCRNLFKPLTQVIYFILLMSSVITSVTLSAYFTLFFLVGCYLSHIVVKNGLFRIKSVIIVIGVLFCFLSCWYAYNNLQGNIGQLMRTKVEYGLNMMQDNNSAGQSDDPSQQIRDYQFEKAFSIKKDAVSMWLGGPISVSGLIENEKGFLIRAYGYFGFSLYALWLFSLLLRSLYTLRSGVNSFLLFVLLVVYIMCNQSLANTYMFGISAAFGMLLACLDSPEAFRQLSGRAWKNYSPKVRRAPDHLLNSIRNLNYGN